MDGRIGRPLERRGAINRDRGPLQRRFSAINGVGGVTTVHGEGGNDFFHVGVAANDDFFAAFAAAVAAANDEQFDALFHRTHANRLDAVLNLHGEGDSDVYTVNLAGQGTATVNVHDNGAPDDGVDTLIVNGADVVAGLANQPNDTFLLRRVEPVQRFLRDEHFDHSRRLGTLPD